MPKYTITFNNTIFYKIVCNDLTVKDIYVGHTTNFTKRKQLHKNCCNNENNKNYNLKIYKIIRENGGWNNWSMILIEEMNCENKLEACKIERQFYEELNATMNTQCPYRDKSEKLQLCREYKEKHRNIEDFKQKRKEYALKPYHCEICNYNGFLNNKSGHLKSKKHISNIVN